ncbi:hypothetical protein COCVIDRAFT_90315 [Bipolaris victoriae FI3]|uniref:Uncharacterized protein n=1 Tax=Bipolaris victoriae (strain FI3) TaxID=930091 RepID=W7EX43_BIPV3|nr:hypothetical protein COCVIDRAFT_90315 [Bipolaris victoriae FI3]
MAVQTRGVDNGAVADRVSPQDSSQVIGRAASVALPVAQACLGCCAAIRCVCREDAGAI